MWMNPFLKQPIGRIFCILTDSDLIRSLPATSLSPSLSVSLPLSPSQSIAPQKTLYRSKLSSWSSRENQTAGTLLTNQPPHLLWRFVFYEGAVLTTLGLAGHDEGLTGSVQFEENFLSSKKTPSLQYSPIVSEDLACELAQKWCQTKMGHVMSRVLIVFIYYI